MLIFSLLMFLLQVETPCPLSKGDDNVQIAGQTTVPPKPQIPQPDIKLVLIPGTESASELPEWTSALRPPAARPRGFAMPPAFQLCYDYYATHFPGTSNDSLELITTWQGRDPAKRNCALAAMTRALLSMQADEAAGKPALFSSFAKLRGSGWARADQKLRCDGDGLVRAALPIAMAMGLTGGNAGFIETMVFARTCPE